MSVIPSVVVNQNRSIGHRCYLIPIIPPRHDFSILYTNKGNVRWAKMFRTKAAGGLWWPTAWWVFTDLRCVVSEPVISLSEVIEDDAAAVTTAGGQHDWGGGVRLTGHPGGVESVCDKEERHNQNHPTCHLRTNQSRASLKVNQWHKQNWERSNGALIVPHSWLGRWSPVASWISCPVGWHPGFSCRWWGPEKRQCQTGCTWRGPGPTWDAPEHNR